MDNAKKSNYKLYGENMKYLNKNEFLNLIEKKNIKVTEASGFYSLSITDDKSLQSRWDDLQGATATIMTYFFGRLLENSGDWKKCYIFKKDCKWVAINPPYNVCTGLLHKIGIPEGFEGIIEYDKSELSDLLNLLFVQTSFMWSGADEFYIVFDHAKHLIYVDEDSVLYAQFRDRKVQDEFAAALTKVDYPPK